MLCWQINYVIFYFRIFMLTTNDYDLVTDLIVLPIHRKTVRHLFLCTIQPNQTKFSFYLGIKFTVQRQSLKVCHIASNLCWKCLAHDRFVASMRKKIGHKKSSPKLDEIQLISQIIVCLTMAGTSFAGSRMSPRKICDVPRRTASSATVGRNILRGHAIAHWICRWR